MKNKVVNAPIKFEKIAIVMIKTAICCALITKIRKNEPWWTFVTFPTRSTDSSSTLIDVILTNDLRRFLCAEAVEVHFVGHILICVAVNYHLPRAQPKFISYRKTKDLNHDQLRQDLDCVPFHVSYVFDGIDDAHWTWQKVYVDVIEDDVPLINVKVKGRQMPFMNKERRRCIRNRKHLRRRYKKTADPTDHLTYKQQRNQTVQMSRKALAADFRNAAKSAKDKPSEFWNTFKPFLHTKGSKSNSDIVLLDNGNVISNRSHMAQTFNSYFVNICSLAEESANSHDNHPSFISIANVIQNHNHH